MPSLAAPDTATDDQHQGGTMTATLETAVPAEPMGPVALSRAYGYMRVPCDVPDDRVQALEQAVRRYAIRQGLHFATFFFEFHCGSREAFDDLIAELVRTGARHVVVPSLRHLAHSRLLQLALCEQLQWEAQADVLAMAYRTEIE